MPSRQTLEGQLDYFDSAEVFVRITTSLTEPSFASTFCVESASSESSPLSPPHSFYPSS